jgi:endonuclease
MAIYDVPVRELFRRFVSETRLTAGTVIPKGKVTQWFRTNYPRVKPNTVAAQLITQTTNNRTRIYYGASARNDLFFQTDSGNIRLYDPATDPPPIYANSASSAIRAPGQVDVAEALDEPGDRDDGYDEASQFAYESDLKNFLSANLSAIEPGLRLFDRIEGVSGVEFPVGGRYADVLAIDRRGAFVVIELKVSRGYDRVVGQLLRYMAWVRANLAQNGEAVRGVIVAKSISEDLLLACSYLENVDLYEYQLSVTLSRVSATTTGERRV